MHAPRSQQPAAGSRQPRIGVFGGSFDPPHYGHLIMAQEARERLALDLVLFVPAGIQPLKRDRVATPAEHRLAMTALAIADNPAFHISRVDLDHPGPSYTVDTLDRLRREWGPGVEMWFIAGQDSLATLLKWRDPAGIISRARLAVVERPGVTLEMEQLVEALPDLPNRLDRVQAPLIGISSTDLRARVAAGRSIRYQVPPGVEDYIKAHNLYRVSPRAD